MSSFESVVRGGGIVLFPSDTVYGLACDPENPKAIERLYGLKGRAPDKAAAVMFFELDAGVRALPEIGARTGGALRRLMPGAVTALVPNPAQRFPFACRADPQTLGVRIVELPALGRVQLAVLQSSANLAGGADARALAGVAPQLVAGVDLVIDGGELPGIPSTVVDLRGYELGGSWQIARHGAVGDQAVAAALEGFGRFDPVTYEDAVRAEIAGYEVLQEGVIAAAQQAWRGGRILELGTGTGEAARRLLAALEGAQIVCVDEDARMLELARASLPANRAELVCARLQDQPPAGPFDLVVSALAVHHLNGDEKRRLFERVRSALAPGGRFVLADVVVPDDPAAATVPLTDGYDSPSTLADQLDWLWDAGFPSVRVVWELADLAIVLAASSA